MLGFLFALFVPVVWFSVIGWSLLIAAAFGAVFGLISHAITGRDRSFAATKGLKADSYTVEVLADRADEAIQILSAGR